jgi:hypothetical protein
VGGLEIVVRSDLVYYNCTRWLLHQFGAIFDSSYLHFDIIRGIIGLE